MSSEKLPVELSKGVNGLEEIILREARGSSAEVYLYGGHVTSWKNEHGEELLFVSSKVLGGGSIFLDYMFELGFSNHGPLQSHGFARNRFWSIGPDPPAFRKNSSSNSHIDLILKLSEEDMKIWPHRQFFLKISQTDLLHGFVFYSSYEFRLRLALGLGGDLMLTSRIRNMNTDGKPFTFAFAYHTYFSVSDISSCGRIETLDYLDNLQNKERFTEQGDAITFDSEVDWIYLSAPTKIAILDHEKKRTFAISNDGLPDAGESKLFLALKFLFLLHVVVWNPWDKKAKALADFGDDEYKHMLCVETAAIEKPITFTPGEEWRGSQELCAVPPSYCGGLLDARKVLQCAEKMHY
ncbi:hypothetical protein Goshw_025134 [Gossypium schwendimanii]|uniref:glucose-6-phosphate 1-epimerase n=1 Tax=Gossypium schwendimanii TaxID=34291 RepID=A0A7J9M7C3_GOSSC|nr:hypothetical protein [Gossypium schwendimanii]